MFVERDIANDKKISYLWLNNILYFLKGILLYLIHTNILFEAVNTITLLNEFVFVGLYQLSYLPHFPLDLLQGGGSHISAPSSPRAETSKVFIP